MSAEVLSAEPAAGFQQNQLAQRIARNDSGHKEVRVAHIGLQQILKDLPTTDDLLMGEQATAWWRTLRDLNPELYMVYRSAVRDKCGRHITSLLDAHIGAPPEIGGLYPHPVRVLSAVQLMEYELPVLQPLLEPWLMEKSLCMVHAKRGIGKTHLMLSVAFAVASGGGVLTWKAPRAAGVLYLDGEMQAQVLQQRMRAESARTGRLPDELKIVTPDIQDAPMPDLGTKGGQRAIDSLIDEDVKLIIVDNLSCWVRSGGAENDAESWGATAEWGLKHRREGRAVVFVHHSGKSGAQRGTSKREDLLDVVINLKRPANYSEQDGAAFVIEFEKARSLKGGDIAAIEARLETLPSSAQDWTCRPVEAANQTIVEDLWNAGGVTLLDCSRELVMNKSTVHRHLKAAMEAGKLTRPYPTKRGKAQ